MKFSLETRNLKFYSKRPKTMRDHEKKSQLDTVIRIGTADL